MDNFNNSRCLFLSSFWVKALFAVLLLFSSLSLSAQWTNVGSPSGNGTNTTIAFHNNIPYVAYLQGNATPTVLRYNNSTWETLSSDGMPQYAYTQLSFAMNGSVPYLVFNERQDVGSNTYYKPTVMRLNGTTWEAVGARGLSVKTASEPVIAFNGSTPYIAYADEGYASRRISVKRFNGTDWELVGSPNFSADYVVGLSLTFNGNTPYVIAKETYHSITVWRFNGTAWETVGAEGFLTTNEAISNYSALAFVGNTPYITFCGAGNKASVMRYNGTTWEYVSGVTNPNAVNAVFSTGNVLRPFIVVNNNTPYVAYHDWSLQKGVVKKFNGTAWESVGGETFSDNRALNLSLAFNDNIPYTAFHTILNSVTEKISVRRYCESLSTPSVSIAASATTICTGASVTFTPTPTNGGTTPTYIWKKNGVNVATTATYTSSSLANNDALTCEMTSNAACLVAPTATSNSVTMTVNNIVTPSVSIAASATTICVGASVTFTPTPTNGGTSPTYIWKKNGVNVATTPTYTSTDLANNNVLTCEMTSNAACLVAPTATSNSVTMTVNNIVTPSVSIAASATTVCSGTSVTFTPTPTNGGTSPTYIWKKNGVNVATTPTYTSTDLANNNVITCEITSNAACLVAATATSNSVTMTVNTIVTPSVSIAASATTVCSGTSVTFTPTPTNGGTSPTYIWKKNGTNIATTATYTTSGLVNSDIITCQMTSNAACASTTTVVSNQVTMTINSLPSVSIAANSPTLCLGDTATLTASTATTYKWSNDQTTKIIKVTPSTLTTYNVTVTDNNGCTGIATQTITVNPRPKADFGFTVSGGTAKLTNLSTGETTYYWTFKNDSTATTANPTTTYRVNGTYNICLTVGNVYGCRDSTCKNISVTRVAVDDLPSGLTYKIGPNPTTGIIDIHLFFNQTFKSNDRLIVSDLLGRTVIVANNLTQHNKLDMSSVANGTYIVQLAIDNKVYALDKIVKSN